MIRFHLDENVASALATALRLHGFDVTTAGEAGMLEAEDELHVEYALRESRVIITHDRDYVAIHSRGDDHAGIGYCHQQKYSTGQMLTMCLIIAECYGETGMRGLVEYICRRPNCGAVSKATVCTTPYYSLIISRTVMPPGIIGSTCS